MSVEGRKFPYEGYKPGTLIGAFEDKQARHLWQESVKIGKTIVNNTGDNTPMNYAEFVR